MPGGGYYSGSVTIVDGVPTAVFPTYFINGTCVEPWQKGHNKCAMPYQLSRPKNLSDPYLADWEQPATFIDTREGIMPHSYVFEDPAAAWRDPTTPGREWSKRSPGFPPLRTARHLMFVLRTS